MGHNTPNIENRDSRIELISMYPQILFKAIKFCLADVIPIEVIEHVQDPDTWHQSTIPLPDEAARVSTEVLFIVVLSIDVIDVFGRGKLAELAGFLLLLFDCRHVV